jgi:hypothetical protein
MRAGACVSLVALRPVYRKELDLAWLRLPMAQGQMQLN